MRKFPPYREFLRCRVYPPWFCGFLWVYFRMGVWCLCSFYSMGTFTVHIALQYWVTIYTRRYSDIYVRIVLHGMAVLLKMRFPFIARFAVLIDDVVVVYYYESR